MTMHPVTSEALAEVGHEGTTLHVRFKSGPKIYEYPNVSAQEHADLMSAPSLGKHFRQHIAGRK